MKRLFLVLLFLISHNAFAQSTFVSAAAGTSGGEPITIAFTIGAINHALIVCTVSDVGTFSITDDSKTSGWNAVYSVQTATNGGTHQCFSALTTGTGADNIVCHGQFGDNIRCSAMEIAGNAVPIVIDPTPVFAVAASGTAMDSGAFVTTATDFLVGWGYTTFGPPAANGSWTLAAGDSQTGLIYQASKAAGTYHATETAAGSNPWAQSGFGIKDAASGTTLASYYYRRIAGIGFPIFLLIFLTLAAIAKPPSQKKVIVQSERDHIYAEKRS